MNKLLRESLIEWALKTKRIKVEPPIIETPMPKYPNDRITTGDLRKFKIPFKPENGKEYLFSQYPDQSTHLALKATFIGMDKEEYVVSNFQLMGYQKFKYCFPVPGKVKVPISEAKSIIAKEKGIDVDLIEIV